MERLTKRIENGAVDLDCAACDEIIKICTHSFCRNKIKNRLAAYEDTGLTPEQIKQLQWDLRSYELTVEKLRERMRGYEGTGLEPEEIDTLLERYGSLRRAISDETGQPIVDENRIRELATADKDGRVVVLPCKVGDTVWRLLCDEVVPGGWAISSEKVIEVSSKGFWIEGVYGGGLDESAVHVPWSEVGVSAFFTLEDAWKAKEANR